MKNVTQGERIGEGKTKILYQVVDHEDEVIVESKDDTTAGDGAKHMVVPGKGAACNKTTCAVFELLKACGIPVAYKGKISDTAFVAQMCRMIPIEVVVRRNIVGSALKREPHLKSSLKNGTPLHKLRVEFFLKTSGKKWGTHELPCDDPLMVVNDDCTEIQLFRPDKPIYDAEPFLTLEAPSLVEALRGSNQVYTMEEIARKVFLILEKDWQIQGGKLIDFKIEFGINTHGEFVLADVIDPDSWRAVKDGVQLSKQPFRDRDDLEPKEVLEIYDAAASIAERFELPKQQLVIWRGSEKDNLAPFVRAFQDNLCYQHLETVSIVETTFSMHKSPEAGLDSLRMLIDEVPDTVIIAFVGMSNGAGPTLSAYTHVPVINVPANWEGCPEDVWSSLRLPSYVPAMTLLSPSNAVLAALGMFANRNPLIYATIRGALEDRAVPLPSTVPTVE